MRVQGRQRVSCGNRVESLGNRRTKVLSAIVDISDRKLKEQKIEAALEEKYSAR